MRPNRIKNFKFEIGSLTANSSGQFSVYSKYPLNGLIYGVHIGQSTWTSSTGSLFLNASGPEIVIWSMVSGTDRGDGVGTSGVTFPRATTVRTNSVPLSGANGYAEFALAPVNSIMHLVGSGLGNGTSGIELNVIYI